MNVFDSFKIVFNKCSVSISNDKWQVNESNQHASFKTLIVQNIGNDFYSFNNATYKDMACITQKRSSILEDRDCDGVALTEIDGKTVFILSELKSSIDSCDILNAYKQIVFTFLKLHMMLSLCQDYNFCDWNIIGIIACLPPKDENQKTNLYLEYLNIEERTVKPDVKLLVRLLFESKIVVDLGSIHFLKSMSLNDQLKRLKISLCLKTADSVETSSTILELSQIV